MLLEYKHADNDDIASIFAIQKRNVQLYEDQTVVDLREVLQQMQNHLQANIESYTKIVCGENVVGYYRCKESYDFSYDLSFLYILQQYRKQGIGTQVLDHIKESCEDPLQITIYLRQVEIYDFLVKRGFVVQSQISRSKISLKYDKKNGYISKMVNSRNRINEKIIFLHVSNTEEICDLMHSFLD